MDDAQRIDSAQTVYVLAKSDMPHLCGPAAIELDLSKFHSGRWALDLDRAFARRDDATVVVAHGVASLALAWWAQLSPRSYMNGIAGALFVSPLSMDFGQASIAAQARLGPATKLPFPSIVANCGYPLIEPVLALADSWGSYFIDTLPHDVARASNRQSGCSAAEAALIARLRKLETADAVGGAPPLQAEPIVAFDRSARRS